MAVRFSLTLQDDGVQGALREAEQRAGDLFPLMDAIAGVMERRAQASFEEQRAPDGTPWTPSGRARATGQLTLVLSGQLLRSITSGATADEAFAGSNLIYAGVHQSGAVIRAKGGGKLAFTAPDGRLVFADQVTIPARPFLGLAEEDRATIIDLAADFITGSGYE